MDIIAFLIPLAILIGLCGLAFFFWTVKSSQYDDLEGAAQRILFEDDIDVKVIQPDDLKG
jgi:cbb3-type cytochrome oxidase maturation protein